MSRPTNDPVRTLRNTARAERRARDAFDEAVIAAREGGLSWAEIARATGMSPSHARWREQAYREREAAASAGPDISPDILPHAPDEAGPDRGGGVQSFVAEVTQAPFPVGTRSATIAAAARSLGVTRPTVYRWIADGRVRTVGTNGRRRVRVDPKTGLIAITSARRWRRPYQPSLRPASSSMQNVAG